VIEGPTSGGSSPWPRRFPESPIPVVAVIGGEAAARDIGTGNDFGAPLSLAAVAIGPSASYTVFVGCELQRR